MKKMMNRFWILTSVIGMILAVVFSVLIQIYFEKRSFRQQAQDNFYQIGQMIESNDEEVTHLKNDFSQECIIRARAAAYIVQKTPDIIEDVDECKRVATLLQVDELHFFNKKGVIYAGTNPEYYDYSFSMGGQIGYFKPMLKDYDKEMCQDIMPNTAEQKSMQYAAVWMKNHKAIVQVGLEPKRVLDAIAGTDISDIFLMLSPDETSVYYAVDAQSGKVEGSTNEKQVGADAKALGLKLSAKSSKVIGGRTEMDGVSYYYASCPYEDMILVKVYPLMRMYRDILQSTAIMCVCFLAVIVALMVGCQVFVDRKIVRCMLRVNEGLKKIEQGQFDTVLNEKSSPEFHQLSGYIIAMVGSLLDFPQMISKALEFSEVPIAICEYVPESGRFTYTSRLADILCLDEAQEQELIQNPQNFQNRLHTRLIGASCYGEDVYRVQGQDGHFVKMETFLRRQNEITILIDISDDILERERILKERDTDFMTGLYNRRAFYKKIGELSKRPGVLGIAALFIMDLDDLKKVNDTYDHLAGDEYIKEFAALLASCQGEQAFAGRLGGDEFALVVYGCEDSLQIKQLQEYLLSNRGKRRIAVGQEKHVTLEFSMGCAIYPAEAERYQELVKLADERMYTEKQERKQKKNG